MVCKLLPITATGRGPLPAAAGAADDGRADGRALHGRGAAALPLSGRTAAACTRTGLSGCGEQEPVTPAGPIPRPATGMAGPHGMEVTHYPVDDNRRRAVGESGRFSGEKERFRRGDRWLPEAAGRRFGAREGKCVGVCRRSQREYFRAQKFELVQGRGDEFRRAAAGSGAEIRCRRFPVPPGDLLFLVSLLLVAALGLTLVAAAGMGSDPLRRAAALGMIAAALGPGGLVAEMGGDLVELQQQDSHDL